ncbi:MAG: carbon-nitrogen hydrolase family protein [Armatimonadetes bacterium]|nr:carbon-nitrogen hydrolase family protein [Armatimonadota bacterium]
MTDLAHAAEQLEQAKNIFDAAALLYALCEDRPDVGWRFAEIDRQVHVDSCVRVRLSSQQAALALQLREVIEAKSTGIEQIIHSSSPWCQFVVNVFNAMVRADSGATWEMPAAAWYCLQAIDQALSARVPALMRRFRDTEVRPLNFNHVDGMHKVFVRLAPRFGTLLPERMRLPDPSKTERTAATCLGNLAFTKRPESLLEVRSVAALWDDFRPEDIPAVAVVFPQANYEAEFPVRLLETPDGKGNVFWVEARESESYQRRVLSALRIADRAGANIAVLPELSGSTTIIQAIIGDASVNPYSDLRLIVAGSYHVDNDSGDKDNIAVVLDGHGNILWKHKKREAYTLSVSPDAPGSGSADYREWISRANAQELILSPIGGIAVMICLDFLSDVTLRDLCSLGCQWFLVPAWSDGLKGKFNQRLTLIGERGQAFGAIVNNPRVGKENLYLFYCPVRSSTHSKPQGQPCSDEVVVCNWIAHLPAEAQQNYRCSWRKL